MVTSNKRKLRTENLDNFDQDIDEALKLEPYPKFYNISKESDSELNESR